MRTAALWISLVFVAVVMVFAVMAFGFNGTNNITGAATANVTVTNPYFWPVLIILVAVYLFVLIKYRE